MTVRFPKIRGMNGIITLRSQALRMGGEALVPMFQEDFTEENHCRLDPGHIRPSGRKRFSEHEDEGDWRQQLAGSSSPGR